LLYVGYLTYSGFVQREQSDAEVFIHISRRLFSESRSMFHEAHLKVLESFKAPTAEERRRLYDDALEQERRAIDMQDEAIELKIEAFALRAKTLANLKATSQR
jgi:hypothetical protein